MLSLVLSGACRRWLRTKDREGHNKAERAPGGRRDVRRSGGCRDEPSVRAAERAVARVLCRMRERKSSRARSGVGFEAAVTDHLQALALAGLFLCAPLIVGVHAHPLLNVAVPAVAARCTLSQHSTNLDKR